MGWGRCRLQPRASCISPDQDFTILIRREPLPLNEFNLQILERLVIKRELSLEQTVRYTPAPLQQRNGLVHYLFKGHDSSSPSPVRALLYGRVAPADSISIARNIGQQATTILARGWQFPGIILVFSAIPSSAILESYLHGGASGGETRCG